MEREVHPAGLDALKLAHVDAETLGRNLLGPPADQADLPYAPAEILARGSIACGHARCCTG